MKKFLIISLIGLLGLNGYLLNKLASLTTRFEKIDNSIENLSKINNQNKELRDINNLIFQSNYKDDLVLNNFNLTIGIILGFFTILIGLGVYLSFQRIDEDIKELKESATTIEETANEVEVTKNDLQDISIEIYFSLIDSSIFLFRSIDLNITTAILEPLTKLNYHSFISLNVQLLRTYRIVTDQIDTFSRFEHMKSLIPDDSAYSIESINNEYTHKIDYIIKNIKIQNIDNKNIEFIIESIEESKTHLNNTYQKPATIASEKLIKFFNEEKSNNKQQQIEE
ncbi:hypothetical protein HXZ88_09315 [Myroides odoratimimus]|uniref:hypothetical protein n=1 Tax=Myroides odoratimimus TaxID=76832 RepID=UPI0025775840|nr:hypothetical protein [Myroides odoratimimus]MDM1065820.1 hypothetical protein [Myroides odoratimimus]